MHTYSMEELQQQCESEQLHLSGAIQPFGALLRIDSGSHIITHVSANLNSFLDVTVQETLGKTMDDLGWLNPHLLDDLPEKPGSTRILPNVPSQLAERVDALMIRGDGCVIIELEKNEARAEQIALQQLQRPLLSAPRTEEDCVIHHDLLLDAFRKITGFDRVMVYRFHEDWSGEVIAERTAPNLGSYLGLRFPASDILAIARKLYLQNPSRMIPDAQAASMPILGLDAKVPDLTWSDLRSVSPVHLEYLNHMGVSASFSVPIRISGDLWGLVACHHLSPRTLSPDQRSACVSLTNAYALSIASYISSKPLQAIDSLDRRIDQLLEALTKFDDPLDGIESNGPLLMEMISAQGFAMAINDDVVITGEAPDLDGISIIDNWFLSECTNPIFTTDHLAEHFTSHPLILAMASGMIAIKARSPHSGWIRFYWFRPQLPQEVAWAGNPNKPVIEDATAIRLSPRRSFERWVEIRTGYSRPWTNEEKMTAAKFRNTLIRWL